MSRSSYRTLVQPASNRGVISILACSRASRGISHRSPGPGLSFDVTWKYACCRHSGESHVVLGYMDAGNTEPDRMPDHHSLPEIGSKILAPPTYGRRDGDS